MLGWRRLLRLRCRIGSFAAVVAVPLKWRLDADIMRACNRVARVLSAVMPTDAGANHMLPDIKIHRSP